MPDATGLELIAGQVRERVGEDAVVGTSYHRDQATLEVKANRVPDVLRYLKEDAQEPFEFLASLHGCDYLPDEPRLGVHYQLLSTERRDRLCVKTRVGVDEPRLPSVVSSRSTPCVAGWCGPMLIVRSSSCSSPSGSIVTERSRSR